MRSLVILALLTTPAAANDSLTVKQCIEVLAGLTSLSFVGQLSPQQAPTADSKSYKFSGPTRMTMALDISELAPVQAAAQKAQQEFDKSLPAAEGAAAQERTRKVAENWQSIIEAPCNVRPGKVKEADLDLSENPIPVGVLSVMIPIIDREK